MNRTGIALTTVFGAAMAIVLQATNPHGRALQPAPSLELGPEVTASVNADGGALRVEPSITLSGETVVVAWNDSRAGREFQSRIGVGIAWSQSLDGGRSFTFGGYLPGTSAADSWLAAMPDETILLQALSWGSDQQAISIYAVSPTADPPLALRGVAARGARIDKPAMAIVGNNWVGIAFTAGPAIQFVRSTDAAATWSQPLTLSATDARTRTGAGVAACGSYVVVAWTEGGGLDLNEVWTAWSADNGRTFSPPERVRRLETPLRPPPGYALGVGPAAFISNNTWLACSDAERPLFHIAYGEGREAGSVALYQQATMTAAGQLQWHAPEVVAGGDSVWAVWPSIAPLGDGVGILYYDSRHSEQGRPLMDVYLSVGATGAFTEHRLSKASTSWTDVPGDPEHAPIQRNVGDYITLATEGRRGIAAWTDGRTGAPRIVVRSFELSASSGG